MSCPTDVHLVATKWILRYLNGTSKFGVFLQLGPFYLSAFSSSNWAGDPYNCLSTNGFLVYLGYSPFTWSAKKQLFAPLLNPNIEPWAPLLLNCVGFISS